MIYLYQRYLPYYRAQMFELLDDAMNGNLLVCHGNPPQAGQSISIPESEYSFNSVTLKNTWFNKESAVWQPFWVPFQMYGRPEAVIAEASPRMLYLWPLVLYCRLARIPLALWGHAGSTSRDASRGWDPRDILFRSLVKLADAYICYTSGVRDEISSFANAERLFVATNTLSTGVLFDLRHRLEKDGKDATKRSLGLNAEYYLCFIGRLLSTKQPAYVLQILKSLQKQGCSVGLLFIGDGPEREGLEDQVADERIEEVHFLGAMVDWEQSAPYLYASDALVNPGYVGLSVNHGLCFGLPTVTQQTGPNGPYHSPEVEYIKDGETGFLVENGNDEALLGAIRTIFADRMGFYERATEFAEKYLTVDNFLEGFRDAISYITSGGSVTDHNAEPHDEWPVSE